MVKKSNIGLGEIDHSVKYLLHKYEDQSSNHNDAWHSGLLL